MMPSRMSGMHYRVEFISEKGTLPDHFGSFKSPGALSTLSLEENILSVS